jgi:hypothetical protein
MSSGGIMSELFDRLKGLVFKYSEHELAIDAFRLEFAGMYFLARQSKQDKEANSLATRVMGPLAEFGRHHRDEASLRRQLADAIPALEPPAREALTDDRSHQ